MFKNVVALAHEYRLSFTYRKEPHVRDDTAPSLYPPFDIAIILIDPAPGGGSLKREKNWRQFESPRM